MPASSASSSAVALDAWVTQVAPDVHRLTLPVPFRGLQHVQTYLLQAPDGWDLVDAGLSTLEARQVASAAWEHLGVAPGDLRQVVLTHHHPDHLGMAGRHQVEAGGIPVRLSPREIEIVELIWGDRTGRDAVMEHFFERCGLPDPAGINFSRSELDGMRQALEPFPDCTPVEPGAELKIGRRRFVAVHTPGHSDGHLAFYDPDDALLLAGDHVLPHITPNIARWPGVEDDPLGRYLASLEALQTLEVRLALPGHGGAIRAWSDRLAALARHHAERLDAMQHAVGHGATVFDVSGRVFRLGTLDRHQLRMAVAETLAHLEHLLFEGRLRRRADAPAWRFEPI